MNAIFNHLWQSTFFAAAVGLACTALRRNSPRLRYWLWLGASMKFLIPFSLLVSMGTRVQFPPDTPSLRAVTVQQLSTYFAPVPAFRGAAPARAAFPWPVVLGAIWLLGALFMLVRWFRRWRVIHLAARNATRIPLDYPVSVFSSPVTLEPGAFGILRPVILLPEGIADSLTPEQLEAVIAHELRHISYRDNLTAALHMCIEMLFWFHPVVWWIGAKLMREREGDCDEAVLRQGSRPGVYARSLVHVCETYIESPLACAAGISGSDLKKRIREIMTWRGSVPMTFRGKVTLATATAVAILVPFLIGVIRAQTLPQAPAYGYDVVSIHRSDPAAGEMNIGNGPRGGLQTENTTLMTLLGFAYHVPDYRIVGAPGWVSSERYDVTFTPDKTDVGPGPGVSLKDLDAWTDRSRQRLQAVLRDRFGLLLRASTREMPIYALTAAKGGNRLVPHAKNGPPVGFYYYGPGHIEATETSLQALADHLSNDVGRPVVDETGLMGQYDFKLVWTPDSEVSLGTPPAGVSSSGAGPSIFTALTEQLGLRLESTKGPVQIYAVEKVERPTEN